MTDGGDPFDGFSNVGDYEGEVSRSIAFAHVGHEMFVRTKAELLTGLIEGHLGDLSHLEVLDVGCGVGAMQSYVAPRVGRSVGVDLNTDMVSEAQRLCPESEICKQEGDTLPFSDSSFDVAFAVNVFHHVEPADWGAFAADLVRVVRPGGLAVVFEHNPLNPLTRLAVDRCEFDEGVTLLRRSRVAALLTNANAKLVEQRYILFFPIDRQWIRRIENGLGWLPLGAQHLVAVEPR